MAEVIAIPPYHVSPFTNPNTTSDSHSRCRKRCFISVDSYHTQCETCAQIQCCTLLRQSYYAIVIIKNRLTASAPESDMKDLTRIVYRVRQQEKKSHQVSGKSIMKTGSTSYRYNKYNKTNTATVKLTRQTMR